MGAYFLRNEEDNHTDPHRQFVKILEKTHIVKNPKHRLATFGQTKINYFFLSEIKGFKDRSRLREGIVIAEKPQIITPDFFRNRFEGFGGDAGDFSRWLSEKYGEPFCALEYQFRNEKESAHIEHSPLKTVAEQISKRLEQEESSQNALIQGPDLTWQISLMKFIVDECMASFAGNIRELDEHGFFDTPEKTVKNRKKEIEEFFQKAKKNSALIPLLGRKLHQYGLFREYEDNFFDLMRR